MVVHYGRIQALHGVSLVVHEGELVTLLGSNGAGKTTMMRAISGLRPLDLGLGVVRGHGHLQGEGTPARDRRPDPGPGGTRRLSRHDRAWRTSRWVAMDGNSRTTAEHDERLDWVFTTFPRLAERRNQVGGTLSGGEQQMLAIGRALMARPEGAAARRAVDGTWRRW